MERRQEREELSGQGYSRMNSDVGATFHLRMFVDSQEGSSEAESLGNGFDSLVGLRRQKLAFQACQDGLTTEALHFGLDPNWFYPQRRHEPEIDKPSQELLYNFMSVLETRPG